VIVQLVIVYHSKHEYERRWRLLWCKVTQQRASSTPTRKWAPHGSAVQHNVRKWVPFAVTLHNSQGGARVHWPVWKGKASACSYTSQQPSTYFAIGTSSIISKMYVCIESVCYLSLGQRVHPKLGNTMRRAANRPPPPVSRIRILSMPSFVARGVCIL
jgi:hypothetical protein